MSVSSEFNGNEHYPHHYTHRPSFGTLESPPAHLSSGDEFSSYPTGGDHSNSSSQPSSACIPKSPARTIIKAYLGEHGHTNVTVKPGLTIREALSRAMKLRKLSPETCAVYNYSDPNKVYYLLAR